MIGGVTVTVEDDDTAQVTGVMVAPGHARLTVGWAAVAHATGYEVQWKSGGQSYNTSDRQATVASGSTTSHTLPGLANEHRDTVRVRATRTGYDGPYSDEEMATPKAAGGGADGDGRYTVVLDNRRRASRSPGMRARRCSRMTVNWETAQEVTVTATDDTDAVRRHVSLTHSGRARTATTTPS